MFAHSQSICPAFSGLYQRRYQLLYIPARARRQQKDPIMKGRLVTGTKLSLRLA